jgi:hypothetical protein
MSSSKFRRGLDVITLTPRRNIVRVRDRARAEAIADGILASEPQGGHESSDVGRGADPEIHTRLVNMLLAGDLVLVREEKARRLDRARIEPLAPIPPIDAGPKPVVEPRTWITIRVVDQTGRPVLHAVPKLRLTDGTDVSRPLDTDGRLRVDGFRPDGECDLQLTAMPMESGT